MKDRTTRQLAQNIALQDIAFYSASYIQHPESLSPGDPLLAIFESVVENKPEIDERGVKKDWNYLAYKARLWNYAKFCKTVDSRIRLDLFKGFQILRIVYILQWELCNVHYAELRQMIQLEKYELRVLRARTAKLWEVGGNNMQALQPFVSTYLSWFSKLVMIDGSILDDAFKDLEDIDAMLMERDD